VQAVAVIMDAVKKLGPGQALRLLATFEPVTLSGE